MALKKDSNSLENQYEKSHDEDSALLDLKNLENKKEIECQSLEVSKGCLLYTSDAADEL